MPRRLALSIATAFALGGAVACGRDPGGPDDAAARGALASECGPEQPARSLSPTERAALESRPGLRAGTHPPLELRAQLARELPGGFAGIFGDENGPRRPDGTAQRMVVLFVDPARGRAALPELARRLDADRLAGCHGACSSIPPIDLRGAEIRPARWDYAQLYDWYRFLEPELWAPQGVNAVGIGEVRNRVFVGVEDEAARQRAEAHYGALALPCGLVHLEVVGRAVSAF